MDSNILNEVKRNRELMGINKSVLNEQLLKSVKLGIKKGLEKAKNFINDKILKIKKEEGGETNDNDLLFDGNLSGLEFEVHEDYTIFKEKSHDANIAQEMGVVALEGLGFTHSEATNYFVGWEDTTVTDFEGNRNEGRYAVFKVPTDVVKEVLERE